MFEAQARAKRLTTHLEIAPTLPARVSGDPARIRQIVMNVLSNALKFTESGDISMAVSAESLGDDRLRVELSVRDTGIGMSPEVQQQVFQPFVQADQLMSRLYGGTGLGVAIVRQLTAPMGGTGRASQRGQFRHHGGR